MGEVRELKGALTPIGLIEGGLAKTNNLICSLTTSASLTGALADLVNAYDNYEGEYEITPATSGDVLLQTSEKLLKGDVKVLQIPYYQTSNTAGGDTVYIGG